MPVKGPAGAAAPSAALEGPKALVVEDSPTQALRIRIALESQGFTVVVANHPREAVDMARRESPHVVLSDVRMPRVDGFQLCKFFRGDPQLRRSAFVLNTGSASDEHDHELARRLGAHGFIEKGMAPEALGSVLRKAIAEAALADVPPPALPA